MSEGDGNTAMLTVKLGALLWGGSLAQSNFISPKGSNLLRITFTKGSLQNHKICKMQYPTGSLLTAFRKSGPVIKHTQIKTTTWGPREDSERGHHGLGREHGVVGNGAAVLEH